MYAAITRGSFISWELLSSIGGILTNGMQKAQRLANSQSTVRVMFYLQEHGPDQVSHIARKLDIDRRTAECAMHVLLDLKLVDTSQKNQDRRVKDLYAITELGSTILTTIMRVLSSNRVFIPLQSCLSNFGWWPKPS